MMRNLRWSWNKLFLKIKWDLMSKEDKKRKKSLSDIAIECILDEELVEQCEEYEEAKARMIYDCEANELDFSKRRTTDLKNNARVIFPKSRDFQTEAKLELLRLEACMRGIGVRKVTSGGARSPTSANLKRGV